MTHIADFTTTPARPTGLAHHHSGVSIFRDMMQRYRIRRRFRFDLVRMLNENPHLISDIGLTRRQAEAEIAKRFWQD
jgi:uncharacterized protein YjiS (DUF1127 family)